MPKQTAVMRKDTPAASSKPPPPVQDHLSGGIEGMLTTSGQGDTNEAPKNLWEDVETPELGRSEFDRVDHMDKEASAGRARG